MGSDEASPGGGTATGVTGEATSVAALARATVTARPRAVKWRDPVTLVIAATTLLGLVVRGWFVVHHGFLLGVTEYDDGAYFGSAIRLLDGQAPYRDFVFVQPPGITLLMVPSALFAKLVGTGWGLASGRVLTVLAGTAGITLTGLLVRHRGVLATLLACGVMAVYPNSVAAAHTVLVECWLVLFCLLGALALFARERFTDSGRRILLAGLSFGVAGAVEAWAIVPVLVLAGMMLVTGAGFRARLRRAARFVAGVAAGFAVPVIPFALASPSGFYQSLITAQIGARKGATRVPLLFRIDNLVGLNNMSFNQAGPGARGYGLGVLPFRLQYTQTVIVVAVLLVLLMTGLPALLNFTGRANPTPLGWFSLVTCELVVFMFMWPSQFHYHFAAFLAPFLALAIALPVSDLAGGRGEPGAGRAGPPSARGGFRAWLPNGVTGWLTAVSAVVIALFASYQAKAEGGPEPVVSQRVIAGGERLIPPGSCVVSDMASLQILANRFDVATPGCVVVDDGLGTDLALSHGLTPSTGAALSPAVAALWRSAFAHADYIWLTHRWGRRIAAPRSVWVSVDQDFRLIYGQPGGAHLYRRVAG